MKLAGEPYAQELEDTNSKEFTNLARKLQTIVSFDTHKDDFHIFQPLFHLLCVLLTILSGVFAVEFVRRCGNAF